MFCLFAAKPPKVSRTPRPSSPGSNPFDHVQPRLHARHAHVLALAELSPTDAPPPPARWPLLVRRPRPPVRVRACQQLARPPDDQPPHRTTPQIHTSSHITTSHPPHPPLLTIISFFIFIAEGYAAPDDMTSPAPTCASRYVPLTAHATMCLLQRRRRRLPSSLASSPSHRPSCDVLPRRDRARDFALSLMFSPHRHLVVLCRSFWRRTPMPCRCAS